MIISAFFQVILRRDFKLAAESAIVFCIEIDNSARNAQVRRTSKCAIFVVVPSTSFCVSPFAFQVNKVRGPVRYVNRRLGRISTPKMETERLHRDFEVDLKKPKSFLDDINKKVGSQEIMTSSTTSANSSLASPGDSGVQLLDSESEMTSVMSASGIGCDIDSVLPLENEEADTTKAYNQNVLVGECKIIYDEGDAGGKQQRKDKESTLIVEILEWSHEMLKSNEKSAKTKDLMTKSDIVNQNVNFPSSKVCVGESPKKSFNADEIFEMEDVKLHKDESNGERVEDVMKLSLNSYELLDYTLQNKTNCKPDEMHVSLSEEVNENLKVSLSTNAAEVNELPPVKEIQTPSDEQIVFRRQRKKKSKSDTPKKRVSFHEDILNSTKIDDIHINHGFITIEPDVSVSFFQRGFKRRPDVVKGRYSWAAEGDAPYFESNKSEREVKSDIYVHSARFSSTSSSSSASISSSIDEEDTSTSTEETTAKKDPSQPKLPKSSCLKKSKNKKYIDTNIVEEETNLRKKKSEDSSNLFGSLKNILNFSTSVPLIAERGVSEGQEEVGVFSTSCEVVSKSRRSSGSYENCENPAPIKKIGNLNIELAKTNLKLTRSEGFYPNYPPNQNLPANVILCDSNVYEHKGISYSYEYDNFQKTFEQQKPKSSTIYQTILREFNFFKKKAANQEPKNDLVEDFEFLHSTPNAKNEPGGLSKHASSTKLDWSDNETISDYTEHSSTKHLNSPKRKISKANHYALQNFKYESLEFKADGSKGEQICLKPSTSKTSLINRFLRNVTIKKMIDLKQQKKDRNAHKYLGLYVKGVDVKTSVNDGLDKQIEEELAFGLMKKSSANGSIDPKFMFRLRNDLFRDKKENLIRVFPIHSAYTTSGESTALLALITNTTFYVSGHKPNNTYCNHFVLPYTELNTILVGPNAQTIHISNYDRDMQCIITTGCANLTGDVIGQLEMAMRRDKHKPSLPAVKQLTLRDMMNLRRAICKQTSVELDEEYFHYSIIKLQEYNTETNDTPLGPNKEGPLMFKISESEARWETAYFILKAGVLYMLSSPSHRVPMRVLPLINGACQGARRIYNYARPHTFQLLIANTTLHLAAPDEFVASEWLQALVHAASGTYNNREKLLAQSCSLLMTSDHILAVREAFPSSICTKIMRPHQPIKGAQALSCATISDITAFRLPSAEHSWCILEFACREVHESSGDWILFFASNMELESFISTLEMIWAYHNEGESFPLSTIPETDPINRRCVETYKMLQNAWSYLPCVSAPN